LDDRRAIATKVRARATQAGQTFAFHFFLRYGDHTDPAIARECAVARQFFTLAAAESLGKGIDEADRALLTEYALAAVELAFHERLQSLAAENAGARLRLDWRRDPQMDIAASA